MFTLRSILIVVLSSFVPSIFVGQHQEVGEKPASWKGNNAEIADSNAAIYAFKKGRLDGHLRYFFCATDNNGRLSDYFANAAGGGIRFETAKFHGFQFAVSGFFVFNIGSSNLSIADSLTKQTNRYEIGLFDIEDPENRKDIDRMEEFYLKYNLKNSYLRFGRQLINTPFINLQDGRMRPTGVEGAWLEFNELKNVKVEGGWLFSISPRSTVKWYSTAESVGLYSVGVNTKGIKSGYANEIESHGAFTLGIRYEPRKWISMKIWDLYFENVMNSALIQADVKAKLNETKTFVAGVQAIRQDAVNDGGNAESSKRYIDINSSTMVYGGRLGLQGKRTGILFNYTHISNEGRYLMPREWGRDPFYTFMPRERNEGYGGVHAMNATLNVDFPAQRFKTSFSSGYFKLPDSKNYFLNKYNMPSYYQINADVRYAFEGMLKGLDAQILFVAKLNAGDLHNDVKSEFNKVNMELYNLVLNYHF
jgi:outer membrane porin, OprD family